MLQKIFDFVFLKICGSLKNNFLMQKSFEKKDQKI